MPQRTSASLYLADRLREIANQNVAAAQAQADEERQTRMQTKMSEIQFDQQKKIHQLALEETKRTKQEELGRETAFNASMGFNIQKHAHLLSDDPKERERLKGIGQVMQSTGMSPDVIINYMKAAKTGQETGSERIARRKEETELKYQGVESKAWTAIDAMSAEDLTKPEVRQSVIKEHFAGLPTERKQKNIKLLDDALLLSKKTTKPTAPPEIQTALMGYRQAASQMNAAILREDQTPEEAMADVMPTLNSYADTVGDWEESQGKPRSLARVELDDTPAGFISRLFGTKTVKKPSLRKPGAEGETVKETPKAKKDIKSRAIDIKNEHPDWSIEQMQKQLETEGYKRKGK